MNLKSSILIACLASVVFAGPAKWQKESCASECIDSTNFFYEIGRIYEYKYEAETLTSLDGAPGNEAQTKITAKVFIQPVTQCEHVLTLQDVSLVGSANSDEFAAEVTRNTLRFSFQNGKVETICGSKEEPMWVLNFKKGILSALQNSMENLEGRETITETDILGECETKYSSTKDGSTIMVEKTKSPSKCQNHVYGSSSKMNTLGYATETILQGLSLLNSEQVCTQKISDDIIKSISCSETHILKPFSEGRSGQTKVFLNLELVSVKSSLPPMTGAVGIRTGLSYENTDTESQEKNLETAEEILRQLEFQSNSGITKEVPTLFSKLVMAIRSLDTFQIQKLYDDNDDITNRFLVDALLLGRTTATTSMTVKLIKENKISAVDKSTWLTSLAFIKHPSLEMFSAIQPILEINDGSKVLLGLSTLVHNYCMEDSECINKVEIENVVRSIESYIGVGCRATSEEEKENILIALKSLGNVGQFVNADTILKRCYTEKNTMEIRLAAIDAWRRTPCTYERNHLLQAFVDRSQDNEIRIASYLAVMKCPTKEIIDVAGDILTSEGINHVTSFVWSHLSNLAESAFPEKMLVGRLIREEMLQKKFNEEALKFSRNFESSFYLTENHFGGMAEGNVIFGSNSFLPRSALFNVSIDMFGETINLFEIGGRIEGFEKYMSKFFGPDGYYPESTVEAILKNLQQQHSEETSLETYMAPEDDTQGSYYLKIFGDELLYKHFHELNDIFPTLNIKNPMDMIKEMLTNGKVDYLKNFNIIDTEFSFPTVVGLPVNLKLSGVASVGFKMNGHFDFKNFKTIDIQGSIEPSAAVKFDATMAIDAFVTKSGIKMISTMHTSNLIDGSILVQDGNLIDVTVNVPKEKIEIFDISHELITIEKEVETEESLAPQFISTRYFQALGMSMAYGDVVDVANNFKVVGRKIFLEKTDTHSSYKFQFKNDPKLISLSFDMPGSRQDKKWLMSLKRDSNAFEIDLHTPYAAANADLTYKLSPSEANIKANFGINDLPKYSAEFALSSKKEREASLVDFKLLLADSRKELINVNLNSNINKERNVMSVDFDSTGVFLPSASLKFDANLEPNKNKVSLEFKSNPMDVSLNGSIKTIGEEKTVKMSGKCRLFSNEPKSVTVLSTYKLGENDNTGYHFSGDLSVQEMDLQIKWNTQLNDDNFDSKISGMYLNYTFNIDNSYIDSSYENSRERTLKSLVHIPALKIDAMLKKSFKIIDGNYLYEYAIRHGDYMDINSVARWTYNKEVYLSHVAKIGEYESNLKFVAMKLSSNSYKVEVMHVINSQTNQGTLTWNKSDSRFSGKLDASWYRAAVPYELKWDVNADRTELNMEGSFMKDGEMSTIFAKASPKSLSISNTFYKPLSIDANLEIENSNKKLLITASSEEATFRIASSITPDSLKGEIKFGETDLGLTARYQPRSIEMEAWWTPKDKVAFNGSYEFGQNGNVLISLETPFQGWEKQDATLTYKMGGLVSQAQLSFTWANSHYFTITSEFNTNVPKLDFSGSIRVTSTLPAIDRIQLSAKLNFFNKLDFEFEGIMNSEEFKGTLNVYPIETAYKATAKFTSTFTNDFNAIFSHTLSAKDISTSLQIIYGSHETKISLTGNIVNKTNMALNFLCQSPFLPEIMLNGSLESGSSATTFELKGNFNMEKFSIFSNCQHLKSDQGFICKLDLRVDAASKNIVNMNCGYEINEQNEFKWEFKLDSEWKPELGMKGHLEGKISSLSSVVLSGYISASKINGKINLSHKLMDNSLVSDLEFLLNSFNMSIRADGDIDTQRKEGSLNSKIVSSSPVLNGYQLSLIHKLNNKTRKTILVFSKGSSTFKIEHSLQILDILNWSNRIIYNDRFEIDSTMSSSSKGSWRHVTKVTCGEKSIEATLQVKIDNEIDVEGTFNSPWTSYFKVTGKHLANGSSKQSKVKFEYGDGKAIEVDSDYSMEKYNKYLNLSIMNEEWYFAPIKAEIKISTLEKKSFELFVTATTLPSLLMKASMTSDTKAMKLEIAGKQTYSVECEIQGNLKEGHIEATVYAPFMRAPLNTDVTYKIEDIQFTDVTVQTSFENSSDNYRLQLKLREGNVNAQFKGPKNEGSFLVTWQCEKITGKTTIFAKFVSPSSVISDTSIDIILHKDLETQYKTVTIKYDNKEFNLTLKHSTNSFEYFECSISTPVQGWEAMNFIWNFNDSNITAEYSRNTRVFKFVGHANANFKRGEIELLLTTPIAGYENSKLNLQHSFMDTKGSLFFSSVVGSSKIVVEYNANIIDLTNGVVTFSVVTPFEGIEKLSVKIAFQDKMLKVTGVYNKFDFEWILKTFYEGNSKAKFSLNLISNIPEWTSFEITGDLKCSRSPYNAALTIVKESQVTTYSVSASYDSENFDFEVQLPFVGLEKIKVNGKFYRENGYFKTYFSCSNSISEINFSGYVSLNGDIPDIKIKLLTPFEGKEHMEFAINGAISSDKSITISSTIGKKQYLVSIYVKTEGLSGKIAADIKLPFVGFENFTLSSLYNFIGNTKTAKINFIWNDAKFIFASKMNNMELDLDIESSIEELKSLHVSGQHKKVNNGYVGFGKISKNGMDYKFEAKATMEDKEFNIEIKIPSEKFSAVAVRGAFVENGITFRVTEGSESYNFQINYSLTPNTIFFNVATPFEFFSFGEIKYEAFARSFDGSITLKKFMETYKLQSKIEISPLKSNININVDIPTTQRSFNVCYDIESEKKSLEASYNTGSAMHKYALQFYLAPTTFNNGFVKFSSSLPGYEDMGLEYNFKWVKMNDIDTFITINNNFHKTTFGIKTAFESDKVICKFETPFEKYETIGFEAIKDSETNQREAKLMLGDIQLSLEYSLSFGNYYFTIKTPFETFKIFDVAAKFGWEKNNKYGLIKFEFNEIKYEINSEIKYSLTNPIIKFKIETPIKEIPEISFISQFNLEEPRKEFEFGVQFGDWVYWTAGKFAMKDQSIYINIDMKSPIEGWKFVDFETVVDLDSEDKLIRISLEKEENVKVISLSGKFTDEEIKFKIENPFEMIPNMETSGSISRSKRSLPSDLMMNDLHIPLFDLWDHFQSYKVKISTPFEKAKEVNFEISKSPKGVIKLNYKRNDNFIDFELEPQGKKKGISVTIKSALPGWELLALSGRFDAEELKAYISGHKNEKKMEITGSGTFTDKSGSMQITIITPYEKFKTVTVDLDYNSRRNIITFKAKSDSSDFNILLEFKKAFTIEVFIPHPEQNTVANGKFTLFNGEFTGSSRFPIFKTVSFKYGLTLGAVVTAKVEYMRNGIKVFELDAESNSTENKLHLQIHGRLFGNHSMLHIHRDGWKHLEFVFHRNDEEFKVTLNGSGNLPKAGTVQFTIDNSFREIPKHIKGSLQLDRNSSPRKAILEVELPGKRLYTANLNYNTDLNNLRKGDFTLNIQTPQRDMRPWKKISGNWNLDEKKVLTATINVGPIQYQINGKVGLKETSLTIKANDSESTKYFLEWKIDRQAGLRDYYVKVGKHDRYVMLKLHGTFDTIYNADISGAFRISRFMNKDFTFTDKWNTDSGKLTGSGTFEFGTFKGTSKYTFSRNAEEKAAKGTWSAETNIPNLNKVSVSLDYNIKRRSIDFLVKWDTDKLAVKTSLNNFTKLSSSNVIQVHLPKLGGGEITVSHDFTNALSKSVKAVGKIGNKNVSYIASWTRNADLTVFDFNYNVDSAIFGKASLHADFDFTNLKDAKANLKYKRNQDKFVTIAWLRKKSATHLENELTFKSHFAAVPTASFHVTADWSKGFKLDGELQWRDKSIDVHVDFAPNKAVATIKTPFEKFGNISINLDYSFKPNEYVVTFAYTRADKAVNFSSNMKLSGKKAGSLKMSLTTPFNAVRKVTVDGTWKKGVLTATYKRNDDVKIDFEGTAEVKLEKSSLDLKFTPPNKGPVVLKLAYDFDKFIDGTGKKSAKLFDLHLEIADQTVHLSVDGFRHDDKVFIELNGTTTFEKMSVFYLKLDSEFNVTKRVGLFEVKVNDAHFKVRNEFEKRKNGFYARSQMESSATPLPGLTLGFGREGEAFIATLGYGDEREVSLSFKGKDGFTKGFSGEIDIPGRGINDLQYDVIYGFKGNDKLTGNIKIRLSEGRAIEADIAYSSEGVKGRLMSPWTGDHSARARRSISDDYFMTDVGLDDLGFTLEGKSINNYTKKGFKLEGEIMGKKVLIDCYLNNGNENFAGKMILKTPFVGFTTLSGNFMLDKINKAFSANGNFDLFSKVSFDVKVDLDSKIKGNAYLNINDQTYEFFSNLIQAGSSYEGTVSLFTPHKMVSKVTANGFFEFSTLSNIRGSFTLQINDNIYDVNVSHTDNNMLNNLDISFKTSAMQELKLKVSYSLTQKPIIIKIDLSKTLKGEHIYDLNFDLTTNSFQDIRGDFKINIIKYASNISAKILTTEGMITGDVSAKLFAKHELSLKVNILPSSTREIIVITNSPSFVKCTLKIKKDFNEPIIAIDASYLSSKGMYKFVANYKNTLFQSSTKGTGLFEVEVFGPDVTERHFVSVKITRDNLNYIADFNVQYGITVHTFLLKSELNESNMTFDISAKTPILYYGKASASLSVNFEDDIQVRVTAIINEKTHKAQCRLAFPEKSFIGIIESAILPSGIGKLEASAKGTSFLNTKMHMLVSDTKNTLSTTLKLKLLNPNDREISVKIATPFTGMKKIRLGIEYSIKEVTRFAIIATPLALEAECFFGVTQSIFNAGVEIKTPIKNWELTEAKAYVPLDVFAPKLEATVYGVQYGLESIIKETSTGGDFMIKGFMDHDISSISVGVRTQVPYEVKVNTLIRSLGEKNVNFGIIFDSSILSLYHEMLV